GFKDARYFSVCFKKEFNMTPSEYMEKSQSI
ncbi:AraC family transcriptional regulator, partial [Parabacteroides goldsteinii]